ncbi:MAG: hypothetical protein KDE59_26890 [Anaerolineales bacterium]|nr:hypothetical protein [Anaerolineales bacterium]
MKPLVLWCRWHDAKLRLTGRDEESVWGELAFPEESQPFRFELAGAVLAVGQAPDVRVMRLDEMGVELSD